MMERFARLRSHPLFPPLLFLTIALALYGNALFGDFVYDDAFFWVNANARDPAYLWNIWFQPSLRHMGLYAYYRPFTFFSFALNYILLGESPFSFHLVSVVLHGLTCWLLFVVMTKLFGNRLLAWFTALFFAVLPIHVEAVAYIKSRDEIFVAFFGLLAWLAFLQATAHLSARRLAWPSLAGAFSLMAFLSKESALVLPGVLAGSVVFLHGWRSLVKAWMPVALQALAIAFFFFMRANVVGFDPASNVELMYFGQNPLGYMTPSFVPWTACVLFFIGVAKTLVPWNLTATYGFAHVPMIDSPLDSWMAPAGILVAVILLIICVLPRARRTPVALGAFLFLVLYFPFSKIPVIYSVDLFGERWLYAPSIGLSMIAGTVLTGVYRRSREAGLMLATGVFVVYTFVLIPRNFVWHNQLSLTESMVEDAPNSVISYTLLADEYIQYGRIAEAAEMVTKGFAITRLHTPLHQTAATIALAYGRLDVAEKAIVEAESLGRELNNDLLRSTLLAKQGRFQDSLDFLRASPWFDEGDFRIRMLLALNLWRLGRREEAEQYLDWDLVLLRKQTREEKIRMMESY
jgi:hypothetical protein